MKNPIWKALAYASIPPVAVIVLYVLYKVSRWMNWSLEAIIVALFTTFVVGFFSWMLFDINYDHYDKVTYERQKAAHETELKDKRENHKKEMAELQRKYDELEQRESEQFNRWDDF